MLNFVLIFFKANLILFLIVLYSFFSQLNKYSSNVNSNDSFKIPVSKLPDERNLKKKEGASILVKNNDFNPICKIPDIELTGHTKSEPGT